MRYVIYGAGELGKKALFFLGCFRVYKFADNKKAGSNCEGKEIITYREMKELYDRENDIIVVIASEKFCKQMEKQVRGDEIKRYFVFHKNDIDEINGVLPSYWLHHQVVTLSYLQSLSRYYIEECRYIGIYGTNKFLPYLLAEVMEQSPFAELVVISDGCMDGVNTLGIKTADLEQCINNLDCLILNVKHCDDPVRERLSVLNLNFRIVDLAELETFEPAYQHKELAVYKDIHKGKRIFVIGNGPSLRIEDLERLHENGEICIGVNTIYRVYDRTRWRADYIGIGDLMGICYEDIVRLKEKIFLADNDHHIPSTGCERVPNICYFHQIRELFYPNRSRFSDDLTKGFFSGATIVYDFGIQLAAYMGAKEIYLLGVDNHYPEGDNWKTSHFIEDYYSEVQIKKMKNAGLQLASIQTEKTIKQYEAAERYSKAHGFRIYNATRGGALEVFERVKFDSLF